MIPPLEEIEVERIHKRSFSNSKAQKRNVNVDMNPMVDLAFLLLTFFMLATTFSKPFAMELLVPAKPKDHSVEKEIPVKESKTLSLLLLEDKIVWYNGISEPTVKEIKYEEEEITALLTQQLSQLSDLVIFIKPHPKSNYGQLVQIIDLLNQSKSKRYAITECSEFDLEQADE